MRTDTIEQAEDVGDSLSVKEKEKRAKAREARRLNGLKQLMASADGRVWMWEFLSTCGIFRVSFTGNGNRDAFDNGMKNAGMPIFADIQKHMMDEYLAMVREARNV